MFWKTERIFLCSVSSLETSTNFTCTVHTEPVEKTPTYHLFASISRHLRVSAMEGVLALAHSFQINYASCDSWLPFKTSSIAACASYNPELLILKQFSISTSWHWEVMLWPYPHTTSVSIISFPWQPYIKGKLVQEQTPLTPTPKSSLCNSWEQASGDVNLLS